MRIAFIGSSLASGGAERVLATLANAWAVRGHQVMLLTIHGTELDFYAIDPGIQRIGLRVGGHSRNPLAAVIANRVRVRGIAESLRSFAADVAVSFMTRVNVLALLAARQYRVPIIVSERVDRVAHPETLPWRVLQRYSYSDARVLVAQTERSAQHLKTLAPASRVIVIPNPVTMPETIEQSHSQRMNCPGRYFAAMGRLVPQKGFDLLIRAFEKLGDITDLDLVIVGDGPERAGLAAQVSRAGLRNRVHFVGTLREPHGLIAKAVAFVLSSRFEGFPNALVEAMACGVPVIAFDCPSGPGEIIRDSIDGLLIPNGDVDALASAMRLLIDRSDLRMKFALRASDVLQRFSLAEIMTRWEFAVTLAIDDNKNPK